jgi:drug/metabolite transporter (DMT)-like permease
MTYGFVFALVAAACSATAAILQSIGARRIAAAGHIDVRLLWRLTRCGPYAAGLALDGASSGLTFAALKSVPLFAVQAVTSSNLSIIALLTTVVLRVRLAGRDWVAVAAVASGLLMLVVAAHPGRSAPSGEAISWGLLGTVVGLWALAHLTVPRLRSAVLPGLLAGLTFGAAATAARVVGRDLSAHALLTSPAMYALLLAGLGGTLLYATALQRGSVTVTSAMTIVGQTLAPALAGLLLLGDGVRPGLVPLAVAGFVLSVAGAVSLARHTHPTPRSAAPAPPSTAVPASDG